MSRRKRTRVQPRRRALAEAVAAPAREAITEAGVAEATKKPGRMLVRLISAGWSLNSNYYPAEVLKRDGPKAWPAGTQAFIDHQSEWEEEERPVGSVEKLAAVLTEDARWDESSKSLVAEVKLFEPWRTPLTEMAETEAQDGVPAIGMSIRAFATGEHGEAEGRSGMIIERIDQGRSVDFVTKPAAGGKILAVLEAVQDGKITEARTIGTWLESRLHLALTQWADDMYGDGRLTRAERLTLSSAIGDGLDAYTSKIEADAPQLYKRGVWDDAPAEDTVAEALTDDTRALLQRAVYDRYAEDDDEYGTWVRDFDPDESYVVFHSDGKTWRQSYSRGDEGLALDGDRVEVVARTAYEPIETPTEESAPPIEVDQIPVEEMAAELARADQALKNSPICESVTARADGSPPTAPHPSNEGVSTMSGTNEAVTSPEAGTPNGAPVDEAVAVITSERDQFRARCNSLTEALTEAQSKVRAAEARAEQAVATARLLEGNEAGRVTVDRMLASEEAGIPEGMYATVAPRVHKTVNGNVPMTDDGKVDQTALEALVKSAIEAEADYAARLLESQGYGTPNGLGLSDPDLITDEAFDDESVEIYRDLGLDEATANLAAKGR